VDQETMLHHLEELAGRLGITVRYEAAAGRVGVCRLRGSRVAVVDANLRVPDRVAALSSVLAGEELGDVYMPPEVRRRLERACPLRVRPPQGDSEVESAAPEEDEDVDADHETEAERDQPPTDEDSADPEAGAE
jgi:hypothetical protein